MQVGWAFTEQKGRSDTSCNTVEPACYRNVDQMCTCHCHDSTSRMTKLCPFDHHGGLQNADSRRDTNY